MDFLPRCGQLMDASGSTTDSEPCISTLQYTTTVRIVASPSHRMPFHPVVRGGITCRRDMPGFDPSSTPASTCRMTFVIFEGSSEGSSC